ncbi:hypothetical protein [Telmatospirillum sp.]|uniref:glycosyltransferase family 2 protein n=1 Tax=Telmatospirillum sp. TaxID=2079197 RepID=UPI00284E5DB5|nr:hypothetical protein [Telmatospirillum sp.]MDR3439533.1 hypothetical protein [Telmatospirillum sp.]
MSEDRPRIAISVPSGDMVHADFCLALASLCHEMSGVDVTILSNKSSIVAIARNNGVAMAQEAKADYLLYLDSDMVFPRNSLRRLLAHRQDIVGATYTKRVPPFSLLGTAFDTQPADAPEGLVEMSRIPTGCLLINMAVFDQLKRPYFRFETNETTGDLIGEDYVFCDRARQAGFRIWGDLALSVEIGHIGQQIHRLADHLPPGNMSQVPAEPPA